jgi:hypothetical protein
MGRFPLLCAMGGTGNGSTNAFNFDGSIKSGIGAILGIRFLYCIGAMVAAPPAKRKSLRVMFVPLSR